MTPLAMKYLKFADIRQKIQTNYDVQSKECQILRVTTQAHLKGSPFKVRDLLDISIIASPATIHKAMKLLISKDLLKIEADKTDGRIKYLAPTTRAIKLLTEIGRQM
jgi:DNA-binding MarR family transcriptional regulator